MILNFNKGKSLPPLANPASNAYVAQGKEYIDGSGLKQRGEMPDLDNGCIEITNNSGVISAKVDAGYYTVPGYPVTETVQAATLEPNLRAENIRSGEVIFGVVGDYAPLINGSAFRCGSFTLPDNVTEDYTVAHNLGAVPSAAFVWVANPPYTAVYGMLGKFRADSTAESKSLSAVSHDGALAAGNSQQALYLGWTDNDLIIRCSNIFKLLSGVTYQWLVIKGDA